MNWVRLWHEMPNDPKWRAIARRSDQRIGDVISVFVHMMVQASETEPRGSIEGWDDEDVAAALDIEPDAVVSIREAMEGKVLKDNVLLGWSKRQPARNDDSAERVAAHRRRKKEEAEKEAAKKKRNGRNGRVTLGDAPEKDKDTDPDTDVSKRISLDDAFASFWSVTTKNGPKQKAFSIFKSKAKGKDLVDFTKTLIADTKKRRELGQFGFEALHITTYLNQERWNDKYSTPDPLPLSDTPAKAKRQAVREKLQDIGDTSWGGTETPMREINPLDEPGW